MAHKVNVAELTVAVPGIEETSNRTKDRLFLVGRERTWRTELAP
jgi:hypothetical protein